MFVVFKAARPIGSETLLTNMTNDVADNDAAYCSIGKKVEQFLIFAEKFHFHTASWENRHPK